MIICFFDLIAKMKNECLQFLKLDLVHELFFHCVFCFAQIFEAQIKLLCLVSFVILCSQLEFEFDGGAQNESGKIGI